MAQTRTITLNGKPVGLSGDLAAVGSPAPAFSLPGTNLRPRKLEEYRGKIVVISTIPSVDTSVCDAEARKFNEMASEWGEEVAFITVSTDLPFALKRWCAFKGVDRLTMLSDHKETAFGRNYGVLMGESRLLARSVFVLDKQGIVHYVQLVREVTDEPNYHDISAAIRALLDAS